jgi:predicted nucleotidyltransferase
MLSEGKMNRVTILETITRALEGQGATKVAIFDSYARREERPESDIDVIVEFLERKSLLELVKMERELSETLGIKVDLLTEKSISPYLLDIVSRQLELV